jgi:lipid-A-disaccharide synthase
MKIFFSAGEPSGDLHGANLIRALRSLDGQLSAVGFGGPRMAEAGCQLHADLTQHAIMWFARALLSLPKFLALLSGADRFLRHVRPDAVVLIDFPGFNWWLARRAKRHGIPVFYYCPPQIWAWGRWRVRKMRRLADHILCTLPFEESWYREHHCRATYVGHPYLDALAARGLDFSLIRKMTGDHPLVTILPGSRTQEVNQNIKPLLKAAGKVRAEVPQVRFAVAAFRPEHAQIARQTAGALALPVEVYTGKTQELIHLSACCMAVSGSVSLELLYHVKPAVILYQISRFSYFVQSFFRKVKYITLVNLLESGALSSERVAEDDHRAPGDESVLMPEYLTWKDASADIARHVIGWLTDRQKRTARLDALARLKADVVQPGASQRAAHHIWQELTSRDPGQRVPRPHFSMSRSLPC